VGFADFQASSTFNLNGRIMSACEKCRMDHAESEPPGTPPCESCRVELREDNLETAKIFMLVRRQYVTRTAFTKDGRPYSVVVDVSIPAIKDAMDAMGVEDQRDCMRRVRNLFHHFLGEQDEG